MPRFAGMIVVGAAGFRPALVVLLARIGRRNGHHPTGPDLIDAPHTAPIGCHYCFAPSESSLNTLANAAYACLSAFIRASGTWVWLVLQMACKQDLQKGTAKEHFWVLGLTPFVEISECTAKSAVRPHRLQLAMSPPRVFAITTTFVAMV